MGYVDEGKRVDLGTVARNSLGCECCGAYPSFMPYLIHLLVLLLPLAASAQSSLPPCKGTYNQATWTNCQGVHNWLDSRKYVGEFLNGTSHGRGVLMNYDGTGNRFVGEFQNNSRNGEGIEYSPGGSVVRSGRWSYGNLMLSYPIDTKSYPFMSDPERFSMLLKEPSAGSFSWQARLDQAVQSELKNWLAPAAPDLAEVPTPTYPAGLSLKQEPWESNKEFESRVETARAERRQLIDRLQAEYKAKVDDRNKRVAEFNKTRQERETKLPAKRRELILAGVEILNPQMSLSEFAFDQQSGALSLQAKVDGLDRQTFSFTGTPQAFRRSALTEPGSIRARPEFQVSDSGQIVLQSIAVEAGGVTARGLPSTGVTAPVQIATVTLPQATAPAVAQQSAISVDRNQVEQILYREENEMLRKRLEEQRAQQELAVATEQAKAAAEIARLRAEAEALKKQPDARPAMNYASVQEAHALVIGNSAYPGSNRLANPANDAKAMSAKLRSLGFKVTEIANANRAQMVAGLSEFSKTASRADLSLLFYAGHGVQIAGTNYMLPVDMRLNDPSQATLQAVSLTQVVEQYLPGKTKLVFLDACRDNPLMASGSRGVSKGLAPISVSEGTLIAYATKDGQTADDGTGQVNSPFTAALLEHLADPEDIAVVLRTVRAKVMNRTNNRQQPWEYGSLTGGALVLSAIKR
jgi:hypothetical protein